MTTIESLPRIRPARRGELEALRAIERDACRAFAEVGLPEIADDSPASLAELEAFRRAGNAWVAVDHGDRPIAYLLSHIVDGCTHIEQVSVTSAHAGRGIGKNLIDRIAELAAADGITALTLTAFRDVPWNAPYYASLGFQILGPADQGPELRRLVEEETATIPGVAPRVAMRRAI
jgi:GNAT superfamily N-acetyltransferase